MIDVSLNTVKTRQHPITSSASGGAACHSGRENSACCNSPFRHPARCWRSRIVASDARLAFNHPGEHTVGVMTIHPTREQPHRRADVGGLTTT